MSDVNWWGAVFLKASVHVDCNVMSTVLTWVEQASDNDVHSVSVACRWSSWRPVRTAELDSTLPILYINIIRNVYEIQLPNKLRISIYQIAAIVFQAFQDVVTGSQGRLPFLAHQFDMVSWIGALFYDVAQPDFNNICKYTNGWNWRRKVVIRIYMYLVLGSCICVASLFAFSVVCSRETVSMFSYFARHYVAIESTTGRNKSMLALFFPC
jgi:hypothetical protein